MAAYEQEIFIVTDTGTIIRMDVKDIRPTGRATQGVRVMNTSQGARVAAVAPVHEINGHDDADDADLPESAEEPEGADDADAADDVEARSDVDTDGAES